MEPYTLILLCILVMAYILIRLENRRDSRNGKKALLRQSFGAIPQRENRDYGGIEYDWDFEQTNLSEQEQIDEITWNDLEMDAVYLRVNNCRSFAGEQALYTALHRLSQDREAEESLRGKIRYFGEHETERERATYLLHCLGKEHGSYYLPVFIRNLKGFEIPNIQFYRFMRGLLFCSFLPSALLLDTRYLVFPLFTALANLVIYSFQKYKYSANLSMLRATLGVIRTARLLSDPGKSGGGEPFPDLGELAQRFSRSARKIMRLNTREQSGLSGDLFSLLNAYLVGVTLSDFIRYNKLLRELDGRKEDLLALYQRVGEIDMAISVASFRASLPHWCEPSFTEQDAPCRLEAEELYHPLLSHPVSNSASIRRSCIVTGSNASGKSTFIKAVAVNVLLAQSIFTCSAARLTLPRTGLITSMALRDDILSGESYYIKEIHYLKRIIDSLTPEMPTVCIVDEILRGTNTQERIAASCAVLRYLAKHNCLAIVASHDIELTQLLERQYDNFHFSEQITDGGITFSYKIHSGPADSKNAIRLLEYMGFPEEITREARELAQPRG